VRSPAADRPGKKEPMIKVLMWIVIAIFVIGLLVVLGVGKLIF
jgi:hypothetical protein